VNGESVADTDRLVAVGRQDVELLERAFPCLNHRLLLAVSKEVSANWQWLLLQCVHLVTL
jgi:hypothetical protein